VVAVRRTAVVLKQRRTGWACAVAATALVAWPLAASARPEHAGARAGTAAAGGTFFGGLTSQNFPVVIEMSKNGRKVAKAHIAIRLSCTSGGAFTSGDHYSNMTLSKSRKFKASFGPETSRNDDGTTSDFEGTISGTFNKARTKVSGKWTLKETDHDAAGAVTDTCDSGSISWSAKP
jgi:hypothetical protein